MATFLLLLAGLVALVVGVLALPMEFAFRASLAGLGSPVERSGRFRWAFGLVDVPLGKGKSSRESARMGKQRPSSRRKRLPIKRLVLNPAAWERAGALLVRLVRTVRLETVHFRARFGLDDPADTGLLWGAAAGLLFTLPSRLDVAVLPAFDGDELAFDGEIALRLVPLAVLGVLAWFGLSPTTWRVIWPIWRSR